MTEPMRLAHVGLTVADLDRAEQFYRDVFGFETFFRVRRDKTATWLAAAVGLPDADIEFCHMRGHGLHLELLRYHQPVALMPLEEDTYRPGHLHVCFCVEDIEAVTSQLETYIGALTDTLNRTRFVGRAQDLASTMLTEGPQRGGRGYYLRDPDGHTLEIWQPAAAANFGTGA